MAEEQLLVPAGLKDSFVGLIEAQDKVARKVCEVDTERKQFSEEVQAKLLELAGQQDKKHEELQQLIEKQNETLAALVEEKVAKLHELAGQQDKKYEEMQQLMEKQKGTFEALVEEKLGALTSHLENFARMQDDDVKESIGRKLNILDSSLQAVTTSETETKSKTVPELRAHITNEIERLQNTNAEALKREQEQTSVLIQGEVESTKEFCVQTFKSELSSLLDRLAITEECSSRLQAEIKEISFSLQEAKTTAGSSISEEERIQAFMEHQKARSARLASLSFARVQLTAPLDNSLDQTGNPDALKLAVEQAASSCGVRADDVDVHMSEETLQCDVCLKSKDSSVRKVIAVILADLDKQDGSEILKALVGVGAHTQKDLVKVQPKWPLERAQAEIELEYGYEISLENLEELIASISTSFEAYSDAWDKARSKSRQAVDSLLEKESMARFTDPESKSDFGDTLLTTSEGKQCGLEEHWVKQEASELASVMQDAAKAQDQLKKLMAPGTAWSHTVLNNPKVVPYSDKQRILNTGPDDQLPCAEMFDPGVKGESRVLEKAMTRKKALDKEPPVGDLVDVSRFGLVFESAEHLKQAMDWMLQNLDVVWLANKCSSPSCLGYRDVNMGVRQRVPAGNKSRVHVTEVQLLLRDLYEIKQGKGHEAYETIRSVLAQCGVKSKDFDKVQKHILRVLDYTDGDATREAADTLKYVVEKTACSQTSVAQELLQQVEQDATAAGIDEEEIQKQKAASEQTALENQRREEDEKLARDAEFAKQNARLQNLEDAVKQAEFERLIFKQQADKVQQGLQQLNILQISRQEEAANNLEAQLKWLETQVQPALQQLQSLQTGRQEEEVHLRHSLERVHQDFRNDTDELRCELQKVLAESSHHADSIRFAERKCEHTQVSCNEALQSIQSMQGDLHSMQIGLDSVNSEFHASELGASLLRRTNTEQIEQTLFEFEQRLFPNRKQLKEDNEAAQQPVAGPALAAARATRSSSTQRPGSARAHIRAQPLTSLGSYSHRM